MRGEPGFADRSALIRDFGLGFRGKVKLVGVCVGRWVWFIYHETESGGDLLEEEEMKDTNLDDIRQQQGDYRGRGRRAFGEEGTSVYRK